jgi:hypothetical protein
MSEKQIQLNGKNWKQVIASQSSLFDLDKLHEIGAYFGAQFQGDYVESGWRTIGADEIVEEYRANIDGVVCGYDLPVLLSDTSNEPSKKRIMLCAQDPLRFNETIPRVTVSAPFGVSQEHYRNGKKGSGIVWQVAASLVDQGYDVWLTDARKLWFPDEQHIKQLRGICDQVLMAEIEHFDPQLVIAFGNEAAGVVGRAVRGTTRLACKLVHPSAQRRGTFEMKVEEYLEKIRTLVDQLSTGQ